jgi:dihydrofolate reductase
MGTVVAVFTMSLDGFIADANDDVGRLMAWYTSGDVEMPVPGVPFTFKLSRASAEVLRERFEQAGAVVTGRRDFDVSNAWGGTPPMGLPIFIVTHRVPPEWDKPGTPFTFVTEGVESAVARAQRAAGDKHVPVGSATTTQQALTAGLLDEIHIDLMPMLLGKGVSLFGQLGLAPINLEIAGVTEGAGVTHLSYRVLK